MSDRDAFSDDKSLKPLRICLLGYRSKPHSGGQGIYLRYLSSSLLKMGHSVDVISGEPYPELHDGVRLIKLPGLNIFDKKNRITAIGLKGFRSYTNIYEWLSVLTGGFPEPYTFGRRMVKYLSSHKGEYDLIHDNQSLCWGLIELQRMNIPVVSTIHHPITKDRDIALASAKKLRHKLLIRRWHSFLRMQKRVSRELNSLLTVSVQSRRDIARAFDLPESKIGLVYNGIDTTEFAPVEGIERLPFRLMATASADMPLKGLDYLLKALASLLPRFPKLELLVVGSSKPGGHTEKLIQKLGIEQKTRFVSDLSTQEIRHYYAESTIAVVPSLYEGFGLPAGEAMSCGIPVISTTGGALPEVVGNAGVIVPAGSSEALAGAIADLLARPEKRRQIGLAGRQRILEKFSWEIAAKQMTLYYREAIDNVNHTL